MLLDRFADLKSLFFLLLSRFSVAVNHGDVFFFGDGNGGHVFYEQVMDFIFEEQPISLDRALRKIG